ncbi:Inner membrane protein YqcE [Paenibacillus pseudetheri]|uniref:Inner membrane protein YqcE n=2 Tax=Paenibacillus pseudetheri TaxID=2897682 RepID=A0ABN8FP79_9BACL|nr:Inner membrane protein YqcE [Paenibacillus pseudetheri]
MQFLLVVLAAGSIYPIIYLKQTYQETILEVFGMSLNELNIIYSVLGIVFVIGYFPSGILSDKFSAKKLLTVSLFFTALGGFYFAQVPKYEHVIIIFCIWGIFSVFTFWGAHMKLVKLLAKPEEEGRFFGILDGGRGLVEAVLNVISVAIFAVIVGSSTDFEIKKSALVTVIYMYSIILLVVSVLVALFVEDDKKLIKSTSITKENDKQKFQWRDIGGLFTNKLVFILAGIIFMGYIVTWTSYYFGGFLQTNIKVSAVMTGIIMSVVLWMRPVGGILGGFLADKIGKTTTLACSITGASICLVLMAILGPTIGNNIFFTIVIANALFIYAIRGTYWSLLGDCNINKNITGISVGFISLLGYLPDIGLPIFINILFNKFGGNGGYNAYFISSAIIGVIGVVLVIVFGKIVKANKVA